MDLAVVMEAMVVAVAATLVVVAVEADSMQVLAVAADHILIIV
jgi:hypothetical protein